MVELLQLCRTQTTTKGNCGQPYMQYISMEYLPITMTQHNETTISTFQQFPMQHQCMKNQPITRIQQSSLYNNFPQSTKY